MAEEPTGFWHNPWVVGTGTTVLGGGAFAGVQKALEKMAATSWPWWAYLVTAFTGGVVALLGFLWWKAKGTRTVKKKRNFKYDRYESLYRILGDGAYVQLVQIGVVAKYGDVDQITTRYSWSGEGTVEQQIVPAEVATIQAQAEPGPFERFAIRFASPIKKGERRDFALLRRINQTGRDPRPYLKQESKYEQDLLILCVMFPSSQFPKKATYVERDEDGSLLEQHALIEASLLGLARKEIRKPRVGHTYCIEWVWE